MSSGFSWERARTAKGLPRGENTRSAKLTEEQVREILKSTETVRTLGKKFNVSHSAIGLIKKRKTWAHINLNGISNGK